MPAATAASSDWKWGSLHDSDRRGGSSSGDIDNDFRLVTSWTVKADKPGVFWSVPVTWFVKLFPSLRVDHSNVEELSIKQPRFLVSRFSFLCS